MNKHRPVQEVLYAIMRVTCTQMLIVVALTSVVSAAPWDSDAQEILKRKVSLNVENEPIKTILSEIENQASVVFTYRPRPINSSRKVTIKVEDKSLENVLLQLFGDNVSWEVRNDEEEIVLKPKPSEETSGSRIFLLNVSGKILDEKGEPLPGVNVFEKGTTNGMTSGTDGTFSVDVQDENSILVFSFIGYITKEIRVGDQTNITVSMEFDALTLQEVVVTALGIVKESRKLGYAASTVPVDEITKNRTINVMRSLEGKIAGLDIAPPTAGAGSSNRIRLRGQSGFAGQVNSPLIVINGLPMDQDARSAEGAPGIDQGDNLQQINPDDIESMTVLKGATAAALYGSRASNGAIIITTKSGAKNSQFGVEFTSNFAADEIRDFSNYQTIYGTGIGGKRPTTQAEAISAGNQSWGAKHDGEPTIQYDGISRPYSAEKNRFKKFYRTGTSIMNTIALTGGSASTSYRASFSNQDVKGITPDNSYHKRIFNLGLNSMVTDKLKLQVNINYTHEENDNPPIVGVQGPSYTSFLTRMPLT
ncbi:MAG TPA: carboxypeptidase-like regulatory domain-containing protein, partial [Cyclobacteriaceae bacterium]|nr:carboxypeptidase-like regulatory domain-containing protein [Cyclobacteriaceae bacterium]